MDNNKNKNKNHTNVKADTVSRNKKNIATHAILDARRKIYLYNLVIHMWLKNSCHLFLLLSFDIFTF